MIAWPPLEIAPHPEAPLFSQEKDPALVLKQAISEISSQGGFRDTEQIRQLLRQAGFVSLWFYLKFIAGYSGPYNLLNTDLHVEMCNFRQRAAVTPGIKGLCSFPVLPLSPPSQLTEAPVGSLSAILTFALASLTRLQSVHRSS